MFEIVTPLSDVVWACSAESPFSTLFHLVGTESLTSTKHNTAVNKHLVHECFGYVEKNNSVIVISVSWRVAK